MSTQRCHDDAATHQRRAFRPHHLAIGLGLGIAVFTALSGIVPADHRLAQRELHPSRGVRRHPGAAQGRVLHGDPGGAGWGAFRFADRMKNWERGGPAQRRTTLAERRTAVRNASGPAPTCRPCCAIPAAGLMHSMIYFGFLVLLGVTTVLEVDHQLPEDLKFLHGYTYQAYAFVGDAAGLVFLGGVVWAILRRYVQRPYRIRIKSKFDHVLAWQPVRHRRDRLRGRDVPHRTGDIRRREHALGAVQLHRVPTLEDRRRARPRRPAELAPVALDRARRCRSWCSS